MNVLTGSLFVAHTIIIRLKLEPSQAIPILIEKDDILNLITAFFNSGRTKNLAPLNVIQLEDSRFSSYGDVPPLDLKDYATTLALEQLRFVSISDYDFEIQNTRVDMFENFAITTFTVKQTGMIIDNYSFRGKHLSMESRVTFVMAKYAKWKIVHIHMTKISD